MLLAPGTRLGPYELASKLGSGGMGEVYRARDTRLGRDVAIKVLSADVADDAERLGRFKREAHDKGIVHRDFVAAKRELKRALELDPNSENAEFVFGTYLYLVDRTEEALVHLDHLSPLPRFAQEFCLYMAHRYDDVIAAHRKTEKLAPGFWYLDSFLGASYRELGNYEAALGAYAESGRILRGEPQYGLAITYARMGRTKEARDILRRLDDRARTSYVPLIMLAAVHANLGDMDAAIALLQRSLDTRESIFAYGRRIPELAPMLGDPRVQRLLDQVKPLEPTKPRE